MTVVTMRGTKLDMNALLQANPHIRAVGNANMNTRGDKLGPGGEIIQKREDIARDYHRSNPKSVRQVSLKDIGSEVFSTPAEAIKAAKESNAALKTQEENNPPRARKLTDVD